MTVSAPARAPGRRPAGQPTSGGQPRLRVVGHEAFVRRARRRRARLVLGLSACVVAGALLAVAAGGAVVVSEQLRLDEVQSQVQTALAQDQSLQVQKAELQAPSRILSIAEHQLGMVAPSSVHYLTQATPATQATGATGRSGPSPSSNPTSATSPRR